MNAIISAQPTTIQTQASTDQQLISLWLHGRPANSQRAYLADVDKFMAYVGKPLQAVTLADLQSFVDSLTGKDNTRKRTINGVKSLFTFGQKLLWKRKSPYPAIARIGAYALYSHCCHLSWRP